MKPFFLWVQHMKPEEKAREVEEELEKDREREKKPYIYPKLTKPASLEEITEGTFAQTS
jgi:hypothetical protein